MAFARRERTSSASPISEIRGIKGTRWTNTRMIAMNGYQSTLLGRTEVAEGTMAFQFEKPKDFAFKAGQYIDLTLPGSQPRSSTRMIHTFSIASSPSDEE